MANNIKSTILTLVVILSAISFVIIVVAYMVIEGAKNPDAGVLKSMGSGQKFTGFNKMLEKKKEYEEKKKSRQ